MYMTRSIVFVKSILSRFHHNIKPIIQLLVMALKQGRKRPLDTPKRMIERREREGERE